MSSEYGTPEQQDRRNDEKILCLRTLVRAFLDSELNIARILSRDEFLNGVALPALFEDHESPLPKDKAGSNVIVAWNTPKPPELPPLDYYRDYLETSLDALVRYRHVSVDEADHCKEVLGWVRYAEIIDLPVDPHQAMTAPETGMATILQPSIPQWQAYAAVLADETQAYGIY